MGIGRGLHHELSVTDDQFSLDADDMGSGRGLNHELSVTDDQFHWMLTTWELGRAYTMSCR